MYCAPVVRHWYRVAVGQTGTLALGPLLRSKSNALTKVDPPLELLDRGKACQVEGSMHGVKAVKAVKA